MSENNAAVFVHVPGQRERIDAVPALAELVRYLEDPLSGDPAAWVARGREALERTDLRVLLSDVTFYELERVRADTAYQPGASTSRHLVLYNGPDFVLAASVQPPGRMSPALQSLNRDTFVAFVSGTRAELRRFRQDGDLDPERPCAPDPLRAVGTTTIVPGDVVFAEAMRDVVDVQSDDAMVSMSLSSASKCDVVWGYDPVSLACSGMRTANPELLWTRFLLGLAAHHGDADSVRELSRIGGDSAAASVKAKAGESIAKIAERV
jgi:hypothetical protein